MFYHSELQLINTEHSMKASMQFASHFLDLTLGSWAGCIQHICHFSPDTSQPSSCGSTVLLHSMR